MQEPSRCGLLDARRTKPSWTAGRSQIGSNTYYVAAILKSKVMADCYSQRYPGNEKHADVEKPLKMFTREQVGAFCHTLVIADSAGNILSNN